MKGRLFRSITVFAGLSGLLLAQPDVRARIDRVESGLLHRVVVKGEPSLSVRDRMKHYSVPAVSVAVIHDFKIEWARAYGVKDVETGEPATTETLFQAGSISKPVAAMTALHKVQAGKLSLDEDINLRLTSWKIPENEFTAKKKVTLANLLSHTGGLTVHGFPGYASGTPLPSLVQVLDGVPPANTAPVRVNMEPGARFRYSGGGTTIAQLAIMDVERKPYPDIVRETVLDPIGMKHSTYLQPLPPDLLKTAAAGHQRDGKTVASKRHVYPEMAAAGLWTTPSDLAKFAIEVQLSHAGKSNKVLSKEMVARMITPFIAPDVGLGFFMEKKGSSIYFGHGGADEGFRAMLTANLEKGYGAVVMVNSDNGEIMAEIVRGIAREYNWESYLPEPIEIVSVPAATLQSYEGRYLVNPDRVLTVTLQEGRLYIQPTAAPREELLPVSENRFVRRESNMHGTFRRSGASPASAISVEIDGRTIEMPRMESSRRIPYERLQSGEIEAAIEAYREIKRSSPNNAAISRQRINDLGYGFLRTNKLEEAIALFVLNVELYPDAWNTYDSLAEAYMHTGKRELAIKNYQRSLELNPANSGAREKLKKLH